MCTTAEMKEHENLVKNEILESEFENVNFNNNEIRIEGKKYINKKAFKNSNVKIVTISSEVEVIDMSSFESCKDLEEVIFDDEDIVLTQNCFTGCEKLKKVTLGDTTYKAHYIRTNKYPYYTDEVMLVMNETKKDNGEVIYELREFYPTMSHVGSIGGCYVLVNEKGEELDASVNKIDLLKDKKDEVE